MKTSKRLGVVLMINAVIFFSFVYAYLMNVHHHIVNVLTVGSDTVGLGKAWVEVASGFVPFIVVVALALDGVSY